MPHRARANTHRGYFGVGIVNGKTEANIGTLWRTASLYEAAFVFTVGRRYKYQASDTTRTPRHTPLHHFATVADLVEHLPHACPLVGVEMDDRAVPLDGYAHPERAAYLLGAEDHGLTSATLDQCHAVVRLVTPQPASMNVATAGALVLDHRWRTRRAPSAFPIGA